MSENKSPKCLIEELQVVLNKYEMILVALPSGKFDIMTKAEYKKENK
jgi:hypothetical protein